MYIRESFDSIFNMGYGRGTERVKNETRFVTPAKHLGLYVTHLGPPASLSEPSVRRNLAPLVENRIHAPASSA